MVLRALRTEGPESRFAVTAGRIVGKAVVRNLVKRRLREAVWSMPVAGGWDFVLNARPGAAEAGYHGLRETISELMFKAGMLEATGEGASR